MSKGVILSVELISYINTGAYTIDFNGTDLGVMAPYGGTGVINGVRVPYGVQSLSWKIAGPEGTPGNGETRSIKNELIITREQIPPGTRYLGLHLYPDYTAEITFSEAPPKLRLVVERFWITGNSMTMNDKLVAANSANRDTPATAPCAKQTCSDVVNLSIFFDGTGNNRFADGDPDEKKEKEKNELPPAENPKKEESKLPPVKKWSNPARIWYAAQLRVDKKQANYPIYISGVGTKYNGEDADEWDEVPLKTVEDSFPGLIFGNGGTRRTDWGHVELNNRFRAILSQSATKMNMSLAPYVESGKPANIKELATALEKHGLITIINVSIFGFSRGAALARAFSNEMLKQSKVGPDGLRRYNGVPIRINFMGLFDTVASFGLPAANIDTPFSEKNLVVSPAVERCVHHIAAHELRFSFPVDLIRKNGKLHPNFTETVYPGVHSDVGGGYADKVQGISFNYARIPMRDMMREAFKSGVRILDYGDIEKDFAPIFKERYKIDPDTLSAYQKYMAEVGTHYNVEDAITAHMKALYSAWGTMTRRKIQTPDLAQAKSRTDLFKDFAFAGIAHEAKMHLEAQSPQYPFVSEGRIEVLPSARTIRRRGYSYVVRPAAWRLEAWKKTASDDVVNFVRRFVHDSKAGFAHGCEPSSYFTARGMAESSRNIMSEGLDWLADKAAAVKKGVIKVYHRAEGVVVETWEAGKLVATRTYRVRQNFVVDTVKAGVTYTVEVYESTKEVVIRTAKRGQQMVITSINTAKKHVSDAADATRQKATEVADATQKKATEVVDATQRKATEIADATQRKASEVANATQKKVGEIADATQRTAREVGTQIYDGASSAAKSVGQAVDSGIQAVEDGWTSARHALGF